MKFHISQSVEGALRSVEAQVSLAISNGMTLEEVVDHLRMERYQGHRVVADKGCDNFHPDRGCEGHPDD